MLDYTKAALKKTVDDIKKILFVYTVLSLVLYIGYLIFASIFGVGLLPVNIALAVISAAYLAFYITVTVRQVKGALSKKIKHIYKWAKISISALTLGIAIYGCISNPKDITGILITAVLFICWALQIILEFLTIAIESRLALFQAALTRDFSPVIKIYNKITRTEESPEEQTKQLNILNKLLPSSEKKKEAKAPEGKEEKPRRISFFKKKKAATETEAVVVKK